jgi:hypothetical protein
MLLYMCTVYYTVYVTVYVTDYVTVSYCICDCIRYYYQPTSAAVQLWKEPNPQLQAKSHGMSKSSSKLSQLISVEVKASEDEAQMKGKKT